MKRHESGRPIVEVLGLIDAGGPALERARKWRQRRRWAMGLFRRLLRRRHPRPISDRALARALRQVLSK